MSQLTLPPTLTAMRNKRKESLLGRLLASRGVTKVSLYELSGVSDSTMRAAEADPRSIRDSTWHQLLGSLSRVSILTQSEREDIAQELGWAPDVVDRINRASVPEAHKVDPRYTWRMRMQACIEQAAAAGAGEQLLAIAEAFVATLPPPKPEPERLNPDLFKD